MQVNGKLNQNIYVVSNRTVAAWQERERNVSQPSPITGNNQICILVF